MNVLKAAKENGYETTKKSLLTFSVKRVVYASTSGTIGCSPANIPISDGAPYCMHVVGGWPYYASKIESELRLITAFTIPNLTGLLNTQTNIT